MSYKEKFRKHLKQSCPDCGGKLKLVDIINDEDGVSYVETFTICSDCDYNEDNTDRRNKNTKLEV